MNSVWFFDLIVKLLREESGDGLLVPEPVGDDISLRGFGKDRNNRYMTFGSDRFEDGYITEGSIRRDIQILVSKLKTNSIRKNWDSKSSNDRDLWVAEKVFDSIHKLVSGICLPYTTNLEAATEVLKHLDARIGIRGTDWIVEFPNAKPFVVADATMMEAICIAALFSVSLTG